MLSTSPDLGIVECSTTHNCAIPDLGNMTNTQCCIKNSAGRAYTVPGSDSECHICIGMLVQISYTKHLSNIVAVFGWLNDSFTAIEQDSHYTLKVGYRKGADSAEEYNDLEFRIETSQAGLGV